MKRLFSLTLLTCLFLYSCSDVCKDVECGPGICDDGTCICPDGFSGANCEIEDLCYYVTCVNGACDPETGDCICEAGYEGEICNDKIIKRYTGTWIAAELDCGGIIIADTLIFVEGATAADLNFYKIADPNLLFEVNYDEENNFTVPDTDVGGGVIQSGTGTLDNAIMMTWDFVINTNGIIENCSGTYSKF